LVVLVEDLVDFGVATLPEHSKNCQPMLKS
jgi:hypothetical protein